MTSSEVVLCPHPQAHKDIHRGKKKKKRKKQCVMTIFYLLVECVGLYPFKDLDTSLPMLTARQVLTLPVIEK